VNKCKKSIGILVLNPVEFLERGVDSEGKDIWAPALKATPQEKQLLENGMLQKHRRMFYKIGYVFEYIQTNAREKGIADGFGKVEQNLKKDLAVFSTGKVYHTDLSASYNIGARYFIWAFQKSTSGTNWLSLQAKVPVLAIRTSQTLSSFISLHHALGLPKEV